MSRILVVDDDADVRELIQLALAGQGHDVASVASGRAALEQLAQHAYDLIVCDLHMPGMDGVTSYREVERRNPVAARRIVLMTLHSNSEEYRDFLRGVYAPVLNKPFTLDEFRSTLARMVGPRR